jgi:hypothetical protein
VGITGWMGIESGDDGGVSLGEEAIKKWWIPDGAVRVRVRESKGVAVCPFFSLLCSHFPHRAPDHCQLLSLVPHF